MKYARAGLSVFPVDMRPATAKQPFPRYLWKERATSIVAHVVEDWTEAESHGVSELGVAWALGLDGFLALDLDVDIAPAWWSQLPPTLVNHTARGRHLIYRLPRGREISNSTALFPSQGWGELRASGGYIVIAGPDRPGLEVGPGLGMVVADFPHPEWLTDVGTASAFVPQGAVKSWADEHSSPVDPEVADRKMRGYRTILSQWDPGTSRHERAVSLAAMMAREAAAGLVSARSAFRVLEEWWSANSAHPARRRKTNGAEFLSIVQFGIGCAVAEPSAVDALWRSEFGPQVTGGYQRAPEAEGGGEPVDDATTASTRSEGIDGATFVLDQPAALIARWGDNGDVLWAHGESLMVVGPTGVGKTTVAGQLVAGLIGVVPGVLGLTVMKAERVLYLAMDRPRQIQRALKRLFNESHRQALATHLVVRRGPLPADLGLDPGLLLKLARHFAADVVVLDSLKDAVADLTGSASAGNLNRAIQLCNSEDVDVLVLHHQRKGQDGRKPTSLEDIYGNTQIAAGSGSVALLWGDPGSELVELTHLKQPAEVVGPWTVEHDHHAGTSTVTRGWDAAAWLRGRGTMGGTIAEAAQAHHGVSNPSAAKTKQTERRLRALVRGGLATTTGQSAVGVPARFHDPSHAPQTTPSTVDTPRGQGVSADDVDDVADNRGHET